MQYIKAINNKTQSRSALKIFFHFDTSLKFDHIGLKIIMALDYFYTLINSFSSHILVLKLHRFSN